MKKILLALAFLFAAAVPAAAQGCGPQNPNCIVPTAPAGTNNNQAASTQFVQQAIGGPGANPVSGPATSTLGDVPAYGNATGSQITDPATISSNQNFYFGSGRPWVDVRACGAVGDNSTDDTAAINTCYNKLVAFGGGDLFFPPTSNGVYCTFTGLNFISGNIRLRAAGGGSSIADAGVSTCGHDVTALKISGSYTVIENLTIVGGGYGTTHPALDFAPGCNQCKITGGSVAGGTNPILQEAADVVITNVSVSPGYGSASVKVVSGATYLIRDSIDLSAPVYTLTNANFSGGAAGWASTHAYSGSVTVSTQGFYIQLVTASCTSGGSAPTLKSYGVAITDGTCTWQLMSPGTYYAVQADTGASALYMLDGDSSGPMVAGLAITNTGAGTAPGGIVVEGWDFGANLQAGIYAHDGNTLSVSKSTINGCVFGGCPGIYTLGSWTGVVNANNNLLAGNQTGVSLNVGGGDSIVGNTIVSNVTGVLVANNYANFNINSNNFYNAAYGSNSGNDVTIGTGATHCNVVGNSSNGGTFSTGACVASLNDGAGISVAGGGTGRATLTVHSFVIGEGTSPVNAVGPCNSNVPITGVSSSADPQCGGTIGYANGGTNATSLAGAQANLLIGTLMSVPVTVNFAVAGDYAIAVPLPTGFTQLRADNIVISQCNVSLSGATFGLFTAIGGGGAAIITAGATSNVTNNTANTNNNMQFGAGSINNIGSEAYTPIGGNIQFRVGSTAAGTCSVAFQYKPVP
jgi:hypothetical protein